MSAIVSRMPIFQSAMRELTISIAGSANSTARRMSAIVSCSSSRSRPMTKAISASTLGWISWSAGDVPAVGDRHVVEQHAVVGLIDAELALHGERGQTDLASDQPSPLLQPALRVDLLRRIGEVDRVGGQHLPHRRNRAFSSSGRRTVCPRPLARLQESRRVPSSDQREASGGSPQTYFRSVHGRGAVGLHRAQRMRDDVRGSARRRQSVDELVGPDDGDRALLRPDAAEPGDPFAGEIFHFRESRRGAAASTPCAR